MFSNTIDPNDPAFLEVARRLEAYADLRLSPSIAATTRIRSGVMSAAHRRAALIAADATFGAAGLTVSALAAKRAGPVRREWRRPVAAVVAGCLTLALVVGTAYASKPGGPLYAARMWTERANLPADTVGRSNAEVARLAERLTEAQRALTAHDPDATEAALAAYTAIVVEAADESNGDPTAAAAIEASVVHHVAVLTVMAGTVPTSARAAVDKALASSTTVLQELGRSGDDKGHHAGGATGNGGTGHGGTGSDGAGGNAGEDPGKSPKPVATHESATTTAKPTKTPESHPAPTSTKSPRPGDAHRSADPETTQTPRGKP